jgi:hypothetical protein
VERSRISFSRYQDTFAILFEPSQATADEVVESDEQKFDTQFLLNLPNTAPIGFILNIKYSPYLVLIVGEGNGRGKHTTISIPSKDASLFNTWGRGYHSPTGLLNMFIQVKPDPKSEQILALRFIPFVIFVHLKDIKNPFDFWTKRGIANSIFDAVRKIHDSDLGSYYETQSRIEEAFIATKQKSVVVLGSYAEPFYSDLVLVRDYLRKLGYDAHLIEDLPNAPTISLQEKVQYWTNASRFIVLIDIVPSGHLIELSTLIRQASITAILRNPNQRSTLMTGHEDINYRFVKEFQFTESPLEQIDESVKWAEDMVKKRENKYRNIYQ